MSLIVGLIIWISTLRTRTNLGDVWARKSTTEQSALQKQVRKSQARPSWNAN